MVSATEKRRYEVLRAIVADYIASQEPVGSKSLLERHKLNVSSATIRNDMSVLESDGFIVQEHASSGRVPTEKGYRLFVDSIHDIKPLSLAERRAILGFLEGGVDLEDVLRRSVQLLSQLTHQAAVVQLPTLKTARVKHCEVVPLSPMRLLLVLITDTGRVDQRNVELEEPLAAEEVNVLRDLLNGALGEKTLTAASDALEELAQQAPTDIRDAMRRCCDVLVNTLVDQPSDRLILAGTSNLTRLSRETSASLPMVLEALEEQVVMLKLLSNVTDLDQVSVHIGGENEDIELRSATVITTGYGSQGSALGGLGVVGPTYMDYSGTISKVSAVAKYVGRVLAGE
ncbi:MULTISPECIES: heat-inducible transcriptional repressor HrcA [Corynebacterium]|uniref:heat-inducible transcriptional repressor HrcA n=1 Tax=Corynebacterium TaxID=1716 RepID=UPI0008074CC9|nr:MULTISPECIES: heat-inducible transcriptional repressor HrcA [Corynebacterium]ANU34237.1 heat-inducible transcriptional repressor HrcA [Corynebacterium glutamicum]APT07981.1 heat-inducible transcriptional repressor HrcA [Corynebacterium glutamicum]OKX85322.1 heat-inducible transcriptional repressor HrcA [Corynebacterium glutamicum]QDX76153.1 HrcA family transcriptional regulator [Corynebacterium glutamicum]QDX78927.1 HrcA family transcriptional regulator [Corynebacterium glutamicum]